MKYNTYFLIVADYINRAKDHDIMVGPWRWSCAGSLLSYALGITDLDPLEYDLIFERFLNPWRISMPDIDTDFEDTQRDRVIEYIRQKYGEEKVAHIGTYMTMAAKAAFKDVARVYGINFEQSNKLSALITEKSIEKSLQENKELQTAADSDQRTKNVLDIAMRMEGTIRQTGVHACGMIIAPQATTNYTVIQHPPASGRKDSRDESRIVSQFDGHIVEDIWLLKMDLLWLRNLSIIKNTIKILNAKAKKEWTIIDPLFSSFLETMLFSSSFRWPTHLWNYFSYMKYFMSLPVRVRWDEGMVEKTKTYSFRWLNSYGSAISSRSYGIYPSLHRQKVWGRKRYLYGTRTPKIGGI